MDKRIITVVMDVEADGGRYHQLQDLIDRELIERFRVGIKACKLQHVILFIQHSEKRGDKMMDKQSKQMEREASAHRTDDGT